MPSVSLGPIAETLGIVGTGAVATGLAQLAGTRAEVLVWARSAESARTAGERLAGRARIVTQLDQLTGCTYVVESIVEDGAAKAALLERLDPLLDPATVIASTTSSLSIEELAARSGRPAAFAGIHLFNPVEKMQLVELAFPAAASADTRARTHALCEQLGRTAVEVPDAPGFVVNRLLFPYLFDAVRMLERHDLAPASIDSCMRLGAGHPMGPLALLDLVGLDVAAAIGRSIGERVPDRVEELIAAGRIGRKSGAGFYDY